MEGFLEFNVTLSLSVLNNNDLSRFCKYKSPPNIYLVFSAIVEGKINWTLPDKPNSRKK
jgi:hypothetical protein